MKNVWGLIATGGIGWFVWETVTPEMWWTAGKWVGTGLLTLITLAIFIRIIKNRVEEVALDRKKAAYEGQDKLWERHKRTNVHQPQIMYLQAPPAYPNQPIQQPAGLVDLPIDKYEWEV